MVTKADTTIPTSKQSSKTVFTAEPIPDSNVIQENITQLHNSTKFPNAINPLASRTTRSASHVLPVAIGTSVGILVMVLIMSAVGKIAMARRRKEKDAFSTETLPFEKLGAVPYEIDN